MDDEERSWVMGGRLRDASTETLIASLARINSVFRDGSRSGRTSEMVMEGSVELVASAVLGIQDVDSSGRTLEVGGAVSWTPIHCGTTLGILQ